MLMKRWDESWRDDTKYRKTIDQSKICTFGIKCLDDSLIGILRNDLVIIGADSGVGKSDICLNMALHNASLGKRIALFFIEGGEKEAIARIKWKAIKDKYYSGGFSGIDLDYRKWCMGQLESETLDKIETLAEADLAKQIGDRLHIYEFESGFKIENLINSLGYFSANKHGTHLMEQYYDVDLIIIDHLQYFTLTNSKNELQEMTEILKKVKDITDFHRIPVVLVSHLRKKEKDRGLPSADDFYGTGNIVKISSLAFTIANHPTKDNYKDELFPTFFRVVKSRTGARTTYASMCNYSFRKNKYEDEYELYGLISDKPMDKPIEYDKLPRWAKKQKEPKNLGWD